MSTNHEQEHTGRHPTFLQYVLIAVVLFAITIVEFVLIYDKAGIEPYLGESKIPLLVGLSAVKFAIVIMYYMHLKFDARLFSGVFLAGLALAFVVGIAVLGLFFAFQGKPRDFAESNAVPFVHAETEAVHETGESAVSNELHLGVVGDSFEFDTTSSQVSADSEVVLTLDNTSTLNQHNWVLVEAGTKDEVANAGAVAGPVNDWIPPDDPRVLFHTGLLDPGSSEEIRFTAAPGSYQFVCTFPGHNVTMFGDFEVVP
jgi:cytochrome c oxidase subunit 4